MCVGPMGALTVERTPEGGGARNGGGRVQARLVESVCDRRTRRTLLSSVTCRLTYTVVSRAKTSARSGRRVEGV